MIKRVKTYQELFTIDVSLRYTHIKGVITIMIEKNIAERIVYYRKKEGLTQIELAEKINYSDKVISKWERGESIPNIEAIKSLADCFSISIDEILGNEETIINDTQILEMKEIKGPSRLLKISIWFPTIFLIYTIIQALWDGPSILVVISFPLFLVYLIIYGVWVSFAEFSTTYNEHNIKVINKPLSISLYIDEKLVDIDHSLFSLGTRLTGKIGNKTIKAKISANLYVKCDVFIE